MKAFSNRRGMTTVEYALLLALVVAVVVAAWPVFAPKVKQPVAQVESVLGGTPGSPQEEVQESLAEKIKKASPEDRPGLMIGTRVKDLEKAGMILRFVDIEGSIGTGERIFQDANVTILYRVQFQDGKVTYVNVYAEIASSDAEPESPSIEP